MNISLKHISKKFNENWIFKDVNLELMSNDKLAILGANGSGKSTLLQIIAGYVSPSKGEMIVSNEQIIPNTEIYQYISIAAPSTELIEEFTLDEYVKFYASLKPLSSEISAEHIAEICYLKDAKHRMIQNYSSGMKQRLKLTLAIVSQNPILLLDEPTSNLDLQGIEWYRNLITQYALDKTIIVCSNQMNDEYFFCKQQLNINDYK
jgi:ATPase subunit of ABC transporter with duplicated ATPase domains